MGYVIEIDEGKLLPHFAVLKPGKGLKYRGQYHVVTSVSVISQDSSKGFMGSAGGAAIGGLVLGPVGFLAGALAGGNKNKTILAFECADGLRLAGTVKTQSVSPILNAVERMKNPIARVDAKGSSTLNGILLFIITIFCFFLLLIFV